MLTIHICITSTDPMKAGSQLTIKLTLQPVHMQIAEQAVIGHCKMALAYLDAREARIAMKLCECRD